MKTQGNFIPACFLFLLYEINHHISIDLKDQKTLFILL